MYRLAVIGLFPIVYAMGSAGTADAAIKIRMLALPPYATIDPFGSRALMAVTNGGVVAATLTVHGFAKRAILWSANGSYRIASSQSSIAGFDQTGALLVNADVPQRVTLPWSIHAQDMSSCENFPQSSTGPLLAGMLDNGAVIATMQSPPVVNLDDTSGQTAPVVLYLRSNQCLNLGNGVALGTGGLYTAGYIAYIADVPAPSNVISARERFVAMRWHERTREPLGSGVAIAVSAAGITVGADALPGSNVAYGGAVHARMWPAGGGSIELASASPLSVAYAIDPRGRVTGMLEDAQRRHYAFLWVGGRLRRLDDLVGVSAWRFECGYAFTPDGGIVGIGTYRGRATGFVVEGID